MTPETATILVAEDEAGTRTTLCAILEDAEYEVIGLESGAEALEMIRSSPFNVIIIDIRLPDVDGLEILQLAKEINPDVAVIMMTGYASIETAVNAVNEGAYAYFVKPVNVDEMKTTIVNALRQQRLSLENKRLVDDLQRSNKLLFEANKEMQIEITERKQAEELFRTLTSSSPIGIFIVQDGKFQYINPQFQRYTGYSEDELSGTDSLMLVLPEDRHMVRQNAIKMLKGERSSPYEYRIVNKAGEARWIMETVSSIHYQGRRAALGNYMDITERKRAEEELRIKDSAIVSSVDAIVIGDLEGNLTYVNPSFLKMWGYDSDKEVLGRPAAQFWRIEEKLAEVLESLRHRRSWIGELLAVRKDGSTFDVQLSATVVRDEVGKPICIMGSFVDITERKKTEELYRTLFTGSPTSVYIAQEGKIAFINPQYYKLLGYGEDELLGTNPLALVHPEDRQRVRQNAVAMLKGNRSSPYELRVINKRRETAWVVGTVSSINYKGKRATLGNFIDITEQKRVEQELMGKTKELEAASQAKSEFLASMSHELRTPLNAIIGFSELMLDGVLSEIHDEQRQCLNDILGSGQHLLNLINDVLDLSKVEARKIELKLESLNLADVIHDVVQTVKPMLDNNRHQLRVSLEEELPQVQADKKRLRQIFFNLLSNAIKFTPAGGKLGIEVGREGDWCQVSVVDSGIGIRKKDQGQIFEPFTRIDTLPEKKREGTGLGLALTRQLVKMCGGKIWVESEYRKGSRFTFTIPLAKG